MSEEREGKGILPVKKSESNKPIEEVPRTNTGVKIDNPEELEAEGEEEKEDKGTE
jgi:hypothetical protein